MISLIATPLIDAAAAFPNLNAQKHVTWYANNIYARRSGELERALCRELSGSVYRVDDLKSHSWWKPEIIHGVPDGGLLAVRPISNGVKTSHLYSWYGEPLISWEDFADFDADDGNLLIPPTILPEAEESLETVPPESFLRYLRHLARLHSTAILYYQCFMWGGDTETEFAFVYSEGDEILYSFTGLEGEKAKLEIRRNSTAPEKTCGDVLVHALAHIGTKLPSSYFAPHTRSFPWERHRVSV